MPMKRCLKSRSKPEQNGFFRFLRSLIAGRIKSVGGAGPGFRKGSLAVLIIMLGLAALASAQAQAQAQAVPSSPKAAPAPAASELKDEKGYFTLDFNNVEIADLVKAISKISGKNFLFDETVRGKVTIISPKKVTAKEAYQVFETILNVKGFTTAQAGSLIRIIPTRDVKESNIPTFFGKERFPDSDAFITRLIPLEFLDCDEISNTIVKQLVSKTGFVTTYPATNTIIVIDSARNINRILRILEELDSPMFEEVIEIVSLQNASAASVAQTIGKIFEAGAQKSGKVAGRVLHGKLTPSQPGAPPGSAIKIIPEERLNALIMMGSKSEIDGIKTLVAKLDVKVVAGTGQIHVLYLQNAGSEKLASVLSALTAGAGVKVTPGAQGQPQAVAQFEGGIKITADPATNSLIIICSPQDYQTLREVIDKLDIPRRQVFVEAAIVEVSLTHQRELGLALSGGKVVGGSAGMIAGSAPGGINTLVITPETIASLSGLFVGGIGETVTLPDGTAIPSFGAILKALASNSNVDILSTPHLLATDNEQAQIVIGENVPFITGQNVTAGGVMQTQIQRQDVGITLRLTPQISEGDTVRLKIYQEISAVSESPPQGFNVNQQGLITRKRSAETTVIAQDKQTVAIGGLMEDQVSESYSRVPILGDLPIIGWLFRDSSRMNRKTNLLLFLTPYIAKGPGGLEQISRQQENAIVEFYREYRPGEERENIFPKVVGESVIEKRPAPPKEEVIAPAPAPGETAAPAKGKKGKKAAPTPAPPPDLNPPENPETLPSAEKTEVQPSAPAVPEQNPEKKPDVDQTPSPFPPEDSPAIKPQSLDRQVFGE
jgi:general secretion pathway protein D